MAKAKAMVQVTVAAPDFASAQSLKGTARANAASALSKIDPAAFVGETETSATVGGCLFLCFVNPEP